MLNEEILRKALADAEREVVELEAICKHLGDMDMKRWAAKNLVSSLKNALGIPFETAVQASDEAKKAAC